MSPLCSVKTIKDDSFVVLAFSAHSLSPNLILHPPQVEVDLRIDSRLVIQSTAFSPSYNTHESSFAF